MADDSIGDGKTIERPIGDKSDKGELSPGTMLGQYRIIHLLGRGGMGEVYEVEHTTLEKRYALKLLPDELASQKGFMERFRREAKVMAHLDHTHIVKVDEFGDTKGKYWLRMELVDGIELKGKKVTTLFDLAESYSGKIEQGLLANILSQVLNGLSYAHDKGAIHRDLKPANILLSGKDPSSVRVKISDFGLVRLVGEEWVKSRAEQSSVSISMGDKVTEPGEDKSGTSTRALLGTYEYMSPEQKQGEEVDERSDLYAVGLMIQRLLTGERELDYGELASEINPELVPEWNDLLRRTLKTKREQRFSSARDMAEQLNKVQESIKRGQEEQEKKQRADEEEKKKREIERRRQEEKIQKAEEEKRRLEEERRRQSEAERKRVEEERRILEEEIQRKKEEEKKRQEAEHKRKEEELRRLEGERQREKEERCGREEEVLRREREEKERTWARRIVTRVIVLLVVVGIVIPIGVNTARQVSRGVLIQRKEIVPTQDKGKVEVRSTRPESESPKKVSRELPKIFSDSCESRTPLGNEWQQLDAGNISYSTDYAHSGSHSLRLSDSGTANYYIPIRVESGYYEAWIYDDMTTTGSYSTIELDSGGGDYQTDVRFGINPEFYPSNYATMAAEGGLQPTSTPRTPGWHQFKIEWDKNNVFCFYLDGVLERKATTEPALPTRAKITVHNRNGYYDDIYVGRRR